MASNGEQDEAGQGTNNKTSYESFSVLNVVESDHSPNGNAENPRESHRRDSDEIEENIEKNERQNGNIIDDDEPEFKLPELDWENLEAKLKIAQQEVNQQVRPIKYIFSKNFFDWKTLNSHF